MQSKWLEDFVGLAEAGSFSRAAQLRRTTQSAFARRIRALEHWAGTDLVDRSHSPTLLTTAGKTFHARAFEMLQALQRMRAISRSHSAAVRNAIEFAMPRSLAVSFFPTWTASLRAGFGQVRSKLDALSMNAAVQRLVEGQCDLLIAYHCPSQPLPLDGSLYETLILGQEIIAPWVRPDACGNPCFRLPGRADRPVPFLGYAPGDYLGKLVDQWLTASYASVHLDRICETDGVESLKAMALEGHGIAVLPRGAVYGEVSAKRLVSALPEEVENAGKTVEIRLYRNRDRKGENRSGRSSQGYALSSHPASAAEELWTYLVDGASGAWRSPAFQQIHDETSS